MNAVSTNGSAVATKLPVISENQNLVSPSPNSASSIRRSAANEWASDLRDRLDKALLTHEEPEDKDLDLLKQELISLFINALQKDNRITWLLLRDALASCVGYKDVIIMKPELMHYLKRLHQHLTAHQEEHFDLQLLESLKLVFPQMNQVVATKNVKPQNTFSYPTPPPVFQVVSSRRKQRPTFTLPDGRNPYKLGTMEEMELPSKPLTFGDLRSSMADVALEMATREAIWNACLGSTALALNVELPEDEEVDEPSPTQDEELHSPPPLQESVLQPQETNEEPSLEHPKFPNKPMTGREAVEYFTKCYHTGKIKSMHFNNAESKTFQPYNLIAVPKQKVNKEHYVFSTFGVLHVQPNQPSENLSLSDWQRESVLFKALRTIPFFKNYLIRKLFHRWRANMKFSQFAKERYSVKMAFLQAMPGYGAALLQISALLQQLQMVKFLTFENDMCYELGEFESTNIYENVATEQILERFFRYTKIVITVTGEELQKKERHCYEQVRQKPVMSKESLHLQRLKRERREENWRRAKEELQKMPNFIALVNHMLLSHIFQLVRSNFCSFVSHILTPSPTPMRDGLFRAKLVFDKQGNLTMYPPPEKFSTLLRKVVQDVPQLCVKAAEKLDEEYESREATHQGSQMVALEESPRQTSPPPSSRQLSEISRLQSQTTGLPISSMSFSKMQEEAPLESEGQPVIQEVPAKQSDAADQILQAPLILPAEIPRKKDDDLGQATPRMVLSAHGHQGQEMSLLPYISFSLLSLENLHYMAQNDPEFQESLNRQAALVSNAIEEISEYISKHSWLADIHGFCLGWKKNSAKEWKGKAAYAIEQKLNELRQWTDKVRSFDKTFVTENGLFYIDIGDIHNALVPRLTCIFQQLCDFVAEEAFVISNKFQKDIDSALDMLKKKDTAVGGFVEFARHVAVYKKNVPQYQQTVEYVKSLYEVIRMSYRQLSDEEEKLEEAIWNSWETFLLQMQEASDYVNTQGTLMASELTDTFSMLEERATELYSEATNVKFTDITQDPSVIHSEITKIKEEFHDVHHQMVQCNKWREAIAGESFDMSTVNEMMNQLDLQQELWQYIEVSMHQIKDWKNQLAKKFNVKKALDKVMQWQAAAGQLKDHMPENSSVLSHWYKELEDFKQDLPIMHRLSSPVLKERHLKRIFVEMGEQYDPNHDLTVGELSSYDLRAHAHNIQKIHRTAQNENMIEEELAKLSRTWEDTNLKLAKHIPESVYNTDQTLEPPKSGGLSKFRRERSNPESEPKLRANLNDLYVVIEIPEMLSLIEDGQVVLQRILSSQYLSGHRAEAEKWTSALQEAEQILDMWRTVQTNWLYLLKIFDDKEFYKKNESMGQKFEDIHEKFRNFMLTVLGDPKVTSVLTKPRGSKGFRQLQGSRLKEFLSELIILEENIMSELTASIDGVRSQFPRLYFLSESETIALLSVSRNPTALVPHVKKCFSGISNMTFSLPKDVQGTGTSLDYSLFAHRLQVTSVQGELGEVLPLCLPLAFSLDTCKWLSELERHLKSTQLKTLQACVEARLDGSQEVEKILEELLKCQTKLGGKEEEELAQGIKSKYAHWLLHFPSQCVLVSEAILFERSVQKALREGNKEDISTIRKEQSAKIEQYVSVLKGNLENDLESQVRARLHVLLGNLVCQASYHIDVLDGMLQDNAIDLRSFSWLKTLRYHMDIETVLQVTTANIESTEGCADGLASHISLQNQPELKKSKTTITEAYKLGKCEVSQLMGLFCYDYEYTGPTIRLMVTPVTERACITLMQALNAFQCGALIGPSGTGKTAIVTDLAQALGRHLVVYNCNEDFTIKRMMQVFVGLVHSGCWVLWNNFDKLPRGLSSVIGQDLQYLTNSVRVLTSSTENQYDIRDQQTKDGSRPGGRRNTAATLHSISTSQLLQTEETDLSLGGGPTAIGEPRRYSVEKDIGIRETDYYKTGSNLPLISENDDGCSPANDSKLLGWSSSFLGHILYNGNLVPVNANYGCFMNITIREGCLLDIPHNTKMQMRQCALTMPDMKVLLELKLLSESFENHQIWARKLALFFKILQLQLPQLPAYEIGLRTILTIVSVAAKMLHEHRVQEKKLLGSRPSSTVEKKSYNVMSPEETCLVKAISECLVPRMANSHETNILKNAVRDVFPQSARPKSASLGYPKELVTAVEEQLKQDHLQVSQDLVDKILLLYSALESGRGIILTGPAGSGKSTCYKILAKALTSLSSGIRDELDEQDLTPDRSLNQLYSQKLKILKDKNIRQGAKDASKKWQKFSVMSNLLSKAAENFASVFVEDSNKEKIYPKIILHTVFPNVYRHQQLFGSYQNGIWKEGLLEKLLQQNCAIETHFSSGQKSVEKNGKVVTPNLLNKWIVLDGAICDEWTSSLTTALDSSSSLSLANGGHVKVDGNTRLIFETVDLQHASPSAVTHCSLVSCNTETVTWKCLWEGWGETARQKWALNTAGWQVLTSLANTVFPATIEFLKQECKTALHFGLDLRSQVLNQTATGVVEVTSFLNILSAFLDKHFLREDLEKLYAVEMKNRKSPFPRTPYSNSSKLQSIRATPKSSSGVEEFVPNYMQAMKCLFAFSYIWGFGGNLDDNCQPKFDEFAQETLGRAAQPVLLPAGKSVYDVMLDIKHGTWQTWSDRPLERPRLLMGHYNNTPQIERYNFLVDLMTAKQHPVLITGAPGVGKSSLMENLVQSRHPYTKIVMTPGYDADTLQSVIIKRVQFQCEQTTKNAAIPGPHSENRNLFFIDDLSEAPSRNSYDIQPALELLRHILTTWTVFDHDGNELYSVKDIHFITAATVPGKKVITSRLARLFTTFNMFSPSEQELGTIYNKIIQNWLEEFPTNSLDHHYELTRAIVRGSMELYHLMQQLFPATPQKAHYSFSLHSLSHLFEGMLLLSSRIKVKPHKHKSGRVDGSLNLPPMMRTVARLWLHESCRVFADRLITSEETHKFEDIVKEVLRKHFCSDRVPSPELPASRAEVLELPLPASKENTFEMSTTDESRTGTADQEQNKRDPNQTDTHEDSNVLAVATKTSPGATASKSTSAEQDGPGKRVQLTSQSGRDSDAVMPNEISRNETGKSVTQSTSQESRLQTGFENSQFTTDGDDDDDSDEEEESSSSSDESSSSDSSDSEVLVIPESLKQKGIVHGKQPTPPDTAQTTARQSVRALKKGVSFKVGLISDRAGETYYGPLLKYEQVLDPDEKIMDIMFSRYIVASNINPSGNRTEKGYKEGSMTTIAIALEMALEKIYLDKDQKLELVFFKDAVQHTARLTRVLARDGSHAILVGLDHFVGCATLVRMAASLANLKLFEVVTTSNCPEENRRLLRNQMQACSKSAAFVNRKVVLFVKDALGSKAIEDVYSFMKQGTCANLYSADDLSSIATRMNSSQVKITRQDRVDSSFFKFLRKVQQNVHVIVCMKGQGGNYPYSITAEYPAFLKKPCSFDIYHPWTHEAYIAIAEKWLIKKEQMPVLWNDRDTVNQIKSTARAMAYIHQASKTAITKQYIHLLPQNRLVSPLKYKEFIWVFKVIAADIAKKEQGKLDKFEAGLDKVNDALNTISKYQKEVSELNPTYRDALAVIENHVKSIHAQQQEYIKSLDICKQQEKQIEELTKPVEKLRVEAHDAFNEISPVFNAALAALNCLSPSDLYEVKSFSKPPYHVCKVMETVCLLFDLEPSWENAKALMTKTSLYNDLEFYDKGNISDELFTKLADFYSNPEMAPEKVIKVNRAAASFANWLRAVYIYADLTRSLAPTRKQLKQAEKKLAAAQIELGQHRKLANKVKGELEARIKTHKEAVQHAKVIDKSIQAVKKKIKKATNLMENMDAQGTVWKIRAQECRYKLRTIPGDALLAAASVIYFGCLDSYSRVTLMKDWMERCSLNDFTSLSNQKHAQNLGGNLAEAPGNINDGESELHSDGITCSDDITSINSAADTSSNSSVKSYHQSLSLEDLTQERILDQPITQNRLANSAMNYKLLTLRDNFTIEDLLSSEDEMNDWKLQGYHTDMYSIHNALISRTTCQINPHCWPLLIDPDNKAEIWVRALQSSDNFIHPEDLCRGDEADMLELVMEGDLPAERIIDGTLSRTTATSGETMSGPSSRPVTRGDTPHTAQAPTETSTTNDLQSNNDIDTSLNILDLSDTPSDKLWIVRADDVTITQKILTALVQGICVLVTHLEYKQIPQALNPVILKQRYLDQDGVFKVTIGKSQFTWHRDFRIYLSSSLPLSFIDVTAVKKELEITTVIDMGVSQEGIINHLLHCIMAKEKPEYASQKRSSTKDVIYHQREIQKEQEIILQRVLNLTVPLLDDAEMLEKVIKCQHNIQHNSTALEDINYHAGRQDEKKAPYLPVATNAANLYSIIKKIEPLNHLYHASLSQFYDIVVKTIEREHRGKGMQGAPKARAQELIQHITSVVFKSVSAMVHEKHSLLFALLITLERLTSTRKLTSQELDLFVQGTEAVGHKVLLLPYEKPIWVNEKMWQDCHTLEKVLPCMEGICESLQEYSSEWAEYFQWPIVLMNQLPDYKYQNLTAFQKCVLWRVCCPQKFYEVCEALILHEMGGACKREKFGLLQEVISQSDRHTPVIFIESAEHQHDTATNALLQYAKESDMEGKVHVVSCGLDIQMTKMKQQILESMQNGHWVVIQDAHLVTEWSSEVIEIVKRIMDSKNDNDEVPRENTDGQSRRNSIKDESVGNCEILIHEDFRLFFATASDVGTKLPGLMVQNSLKMSHEQRTDIKETFIYSYKIVNQLISKSNKISISKDAAVSLALLHSVLKHSTFYGGTIYENLPDWNISTLEKATEAMVDVTRLNLNNDCLKQSISKIYCDQCFDSQDEMAVENLISILIINQQDQVKMSENTKEIQGILKQLTVSLGTETSEDMAMDPKLLCLSNFTGQTLGLPASTENYLIGQKSSGLLEALRLVLDIQERAGKEKDLDPWGSWSLLEELELMLNDLPDLPKTKADGFYPMEIFLHTEVEAWKQMLLTVKSDIHQLQSIARGDTPCMPSHEKIMRDISEQRIPASWQLWTSASIPVTQWVKQMKIRLELLNKYTKEEKPMAYNLSIFLRPDRFIQCVIQTHARKQFKDVSQLILDIQLLKEDTVASAPTEGVHIKGLQLHNASWNQVRGILPSQKTDSIHSLPVLLIKPQEVKNKGTLHQKDHKNEKDSVYKCPVYIGGNKLAFQIPLPCQQDQPAYLAHCRTYISSKICLETV